MVHDEHRQPRKRQQQDDRQKERHGKRIEHMAADDAVGDELRQKAERGAKQILPYIIAHCAVNLTDRIDREAWHDAKRNEQRAFRFAVAVIQNAPHVVIAHKESVYQPAAEVFAPQIFDEGQQRKAHKVNEYRVGRRESDTRDHADRGNG